MQLSNQGNKEESPQLADRHQSEHTLGNSEKSVSSMDNPRFNPLRRMSLFSGSSSLEGWILQRGEAPMVRVSPWVIKEGNNSLINSLVGFLKQPEYGLSRIQKWLKS